MALSTAKASHLSVGDLHGLHSSHTEPKLISQSVGLHEIPTKIIKITKTVAIKVPVPYPVKVRQIFHCSSSTSTLYFFSTSYCFCSGFQRYWYFDTMFSVSSGSSSYPSTGTGKSSICDPCTADSESSASRADRSVQTSAYRASSAGSSGCLETSSDTATRSCAPSRKYRQTGILSGTSSCTVPAIRKPPWVIFWIQSRWWSRQWGFRSSRVSSLHLLYRWISSSRSRRKFPGQERKISTITARLHNWPLVYYLQSVSLNQSLPSFVVEY